MPAQCLPTYIDFTTIWRELKPRKFRRVKGLQDFDETKKDEAAIPPRPRAGAERGYVFQKDDLKLKMWTSWVPGLPVARKKDSGWVVIEQVGREVKYFHQFHRTKNFVANFLMEAKIARCRILNRPACAFCKSPMMIVSKRNGSYFWQCPESGSHPLFKSNMPWDTPAFREALPSEALQHLKRRRGAHKRHLRDCHERGVPINTARHKRKSWTVRQLATSSF